MSYLPPVEVEITGNTDGLVAAVARAKAALDSLKNTGGDIKIGADINTAQIARAAEETKALDRALGATATGGGRRWTGWLATAHTVLTVFGANIAADLIGIVAFGIGATAAFAPVIEAVSNLGQTYGYLNPLQKQAAVSITNFIHSFQAANQAGIFATFRDLLDGVRGAVGHTGGVMDQATHAFQNFAALLRSDFSSPQWANLFSRSSGIIEKDLNALFRFINAIIQVIPALFHDFNSLGLWVLNSASLFLHLVAALGNSHAALVRFAAGVFLVYRALRMLGQFNQGSMLMNALTPLTRNLPVLSGLFQNFRQFGLVPTIGMLTAAVPEAFAIAGAAALAGGVLLGIALGKPIGPTQQLIDNMARMDDATNGNAAGYQKLADQLNTYKASLVQAGSRTSLVGQQLGEYQGRLGEVSQAQVHAQQTADTLRGNLGYLERTYHLTQAQAFQLAKATGTNLYSAFQKGGGAAQAVRDKIQAYEQVVRAARNPTSTLGYDLGLAANKALALDDRVTALTNAFNALLTPFANVIQDTVQWKQGNNQLESAVDKANGKVSYANKLSQDAAAKLATQINNTTNLSQAILQQTGSMQKAAGPILKEIGYLESLHSKSRLVAEAIKILQQYLDNLHSKSITVTTNMVTTYSGTYAHRGTQGPSSGGYASGTTSAKPGWAMVGEKGPELMYFKGGETVVPNHALAGAKGYADGTVNLSQPPINIYLDGKVIYKSVESQVYSKNMQNGVRNQHGGAQGRFGVR